MPVLSEIEKSRSFPVVSREMLFVSSSNLEKADPATRKLIRSHAMRGRKSKNRRMDRDQQTSSRRTKATSTKAVQFELEEVLKMYTELVPDRVGNEFSFVQFASNIELSRLLNLAYITPVASRIMFPILAATSFEIDKQAWLYSLESDTAALHIVVFTIEKFIDKILRHRENIVNLPAELHLQKGLRLLRERLLGGDEETKISDSTMGAVLKLANAAHFEGDYHAAKHHMEGLRGMVDLRGGLNTFQGKHIMAEMLRCDLSIALLNSSTPVFYQQPAEPIIDYPEKLLSKSGSEIYLEDTLEFLRPLDNELATAGQALRRFCFMINVGTQTQRLVRPEFIYETMTAVLYRLLHMRFANDSISEVVRNGLLAFSYHVFLQWKDIRLPYDHFPSTYKSCVLSIKNMGEISSQLTLWLLMTGAISVFKISDEAWLRDSMRDYACRCQVKTWRDMREVQKSVMWIESLDNEQGKKIWNLLQLDVGKIDQTASVDSKLRWVA